MGADVNYIGYVEGRDINKGKADIIVTDGFTGNVALKTMEGLASLILGNLRDVLAGGWPGRIAYLLIRKRLAVMRQRLDPHETGGAPLLGVNGVAIIAHGSSNARAIRNAVRAAGNEALVKYVNAEISEILLRSQPAVAAKPSGKGIRAIFSRMRERLQRHPKDEAAKPIDLPAEAAVTNHVARPAEPAFLEDIPRTSPFKPAPPDLSASTNGTKALEAEPAEEKARPTRRRPLPNTTRTG